MKFPKNLKRGNLLYIKWADCWATIRWTSHQDALKQESYNVESIGWFEGFAKGGELLLSGTHSLENDDISSLQFIPKKMIIKIRKIKQ